MNHEEFKNEFVDALKERLYERGNEVEVTINTVEKMNESYEAMPASVEELPTYSNMPQSTLKQPAIEEADNN